MTERERLVAILTELELPAGQWVLAGSGSLVIRGIERPRPMGDVDIFIATRTWFMMEHTRTWSVFTTDPNDRKRRCDPPYLFKELYDLEVNVFGSWRLRSNGNIDAAWWIHNAEDVDGWPCVPLQLLLDWKRSEGRAKDVDDIKIIEGVI